MIHSQKVRFDNEVEIREFDVESPANVYTKSVIIDVGGSDGDTDGDLGLWPRGRPRCIRVDIAEQSSRWKEWGTVIGAILVIAAILGVLFFFLQTLRRDKTPQ